jgi:hypothetical protein
MTVVPYGRVEPYRFVIVAKVQSTGFTDSEGHRWSYRNAFGKPWGYGSSWMAPHIRPYRETDEEDNAEREKDIREEQARNLCSSVNWRVMPIEAVFRVAEIIREVKRHEREETR